MSLLDLPEETKFASEDRLQAAFWKSVWDRFPEFRFHIWAVPNGDNRDIGDAMRLKSMGLLSGVWDLHAFWRGQFWIIEAKLPGGTLTRNKLRKNKAGKPTGIQFGQVEWGERMRDHGAKSRIFTTVEEGIAIIEEILLT